MQSSRIEQELDDIFEFIESCRMQRLSSTKVVVPKDELYDLLDDLRRDVPEEIKRYQKILRQRDAILDDAEKKAAAKEESETKKDWKRSKEEQAKERKRQNDLKKVENRIEELEQLISSFDEEMSKPENATNPAKLTELSTQQAEANEELESLYEQWEKLSEE